MANNKSGKKRIKTHLRNQLRNRAGRSTLRGELKELAEVSGEKRVEATSKLQSVLDRAVHSGLIHKNKAARLKSRFKS